MRHDLVGCRGVDIECADHGLGVKKRPKCFLHFGVVRPVVLLRSLSGVPKANPNDSVVLSVGDENDLIDKAFLFLQDRQYLFIDGVGELLTLAWFRGYFDYPSEHTCAPFVGWG